MLPVHPKEGRFEPCQIPPNRLKTYFNTPPPKVTAPAPAWLPSSPRDNIPSNNKLTGSVTVEEIQSHMGVRRLFHQGVLCMRQKFWGHGLLKQAKARGATAPLEPPSPPPPSYAFTPLLSKPSAIARLMPADARTAPVHI